MILEPVKVQSFPCSCSMWLSGYLYFYVSFADTKTVFQLLTRQENGSLLHVKLRWILKCVHQNKFVKYDAISVTCTDCDRQKRGRRPFQVLAAVWKRLLLVSSLKGWRAFSPLVSTHLSLDNTIRPLCLLTSSRDSTTADDEATGG